MSETLFASCAPGAETALAAELERAGHAGIVEKGGVTFSGPKGTYAWANVWLRCAERVRLQVARVSKPDALREIDWTPFVPQGSAPKVEGDGEGLGPFKKAAQGFWKPASEDFTALLRMGNGDCVVSVDTSGLLLHFRGYRQELGRAPMRETLAAAMLELAGYEPAQPLYDLMCGSGTLLIEAAWWALEKAPGAMRAFAFQQWPSYDRAAFEELPKQLANPVTPRLYGSDLNAGALGVTRRNARRAGVQEHLTLTRSDSRAARPPEGAQPGLVVANLPYGIRAGEKSELGKLYSELGSQLHAAFRGWRFGFLLQEGEEQLGLNIEHTYPIENGGVRCKLVVGSC